MKRTLLTILMFATLLLPGPAGAAKLVVVFGLDETGSYSFREKSIAVASRVISDLKPGDVFYARRITHSSYNDDCNIFRLNLPEVGEPPQNRFDKRARHAWQSKVSVIEGLKGEAANALARLAPVKAKKTDIWGFFAAAADRFRAECRGDCSRVIVIASDMKDNVNRESAMDLAGAIVLVAGFESGDDPALARKIMQGWTKSLQKHGVSAVEFLPPDYPLTLTTHLKEVQIQ